MARVWAARVGVWVEALEAAEWASGSVVEKVVVEWAMEAKAEVELVVAKGAETEVVA